MQDGLQGLLGRFPDLGRMALVWLTDIGLARSSWGIAIPLPPVMNTHVFLTDRCELNSLSLVAMLSDPL